MGGGDSKLVKPGYVIGVYNDEELRNDGNMHAVSDDFKQLTETYTNRVLSAPERGFTNKFRVSTKEPYDVKAEVDIAELFGDDVLRHKIINILNAYSRMVDTINTSINRDCDSIHGFCPRHVIDPITKNQRDVTSFDILQPCQLRTCMKSQLRAQLSKYKRWIINMKWAGDQGKSSSAVEDQVVNRVAMLEILESLQKLPLRMIEDTGAYSDPSTPSTLSVPDTQSTFLNKFNNSKIALLVVFAILIVLVALLIYYIVSARGGTGSADSKQVPTMV